MRLLQPISADEMVAHFLQTEIRSLRFEDTILGLLAKDGKDRTIVDNPDLHDPTENAYRATLLGKWRGYGRDAHICQDFPEDVVWYRAALDRADWERVMYINDTEFWNEFSGGSRLVRDAVQRIYAGEVPAEEADWF